MWVGVAGRQVIGIPAVCGADSASAIGDISRQVAGTASAGERDGTGVGTTVESILLVGFANTGSTSTNDGLITLA